MGSCPDTDIDPKMLQILHKGNIIILTMFSYQCVCPWETELLSFGKHGPCFELHYLKLKNKNFRSHRSVRNLA